MDLYLEPDRASLHLYPARGRRSTSNRMLQMPIAPALGLGDPNLSLLRVAQEALEAELGRQGRLAAGPAVGLARQERRARICAAPWAAPAAFLRLD